ncbi:hypothetical protein [Stenotrophomonas maltophilia]|uniref:hypothetical protein n=1 Tax=Stenotrophomonas maltophilia TaxID=40324 RepID=UPI0015DFB779|nr:hypothetical protein [Stenotrophomonas maltophilia]
MRKYHDSIFERTTISLRTGANIAIPANFTNLSSSVIRSCTLLQHLLQKIIYVTHGAELLSAKRTLKEFPNPKARIDFLCSFPYSEHDPILLSTFNYARSLFRGIYELRNVLSHEIWASSEEYDDAIIFSSLDEQARLLMATGRIWHVENATSQEIHGALIRFIQSVKLVTSTNLRTAVDDASLCSWILMHIEGILEEPDPTRRKEARQLFLQYKGTSHLFEGAQATNGMLNYNSTKKKTIHR